MATSKQAGYVCCSKENDTQHSSCECTSNLFKCMFPALIRCHKKVQACQWTGPLKDLDAHTCYYVDVECPKSCGENVQKRNEETCAKKCPKRDEMTFCGAFQCFQDHSHGCLGDCEATIEQDVPKSHDVIQVSSKQKVPCELSCTVCEAATLKIGQEQQQAFEEKFQKQQQAQHEALVQVEMKHKDVAKELKEQQETFIQDQQDKNEKKFQILVQTFKERHTNDANELREQFKQEQQVLLDKKFQEFQILVQTLKETHKDELREQQHTFKTKKYCVMDTVTTKNITSIDFTDYQKHKEEKTNISRQLKTYKRDGHNYSLTLYPNGTEEGTGSHLSLKIFPDPDYENQSDYPSCIIITIELRNQYKDQDHVRDQDHVARVITYKSPDYIKMNFKESGSPEQDTSGIKFIPLDNLELNSDRQTEYLKEDGCLKFRVVQQKIIEPIYAWRKHKLERLMVQT